MNIMPGQNVGKGGEAHRAPASDYAHMASAGSYYSGYPSCYGAYITPPEMMVGSYMQPTNFGPGPSLYFGPRDEQRSPTRYGPAGSNLFVFHLPAEMDNISLYQLFRSFGFILSVRIMINFDTGLSRGYGFVSFSQPAEAQAAIAGMNGFHVGNKRLKVQLKQEDRRLTSHHRHSVEYKEEAGYSSEEGVGHGDYPESLPATGYRAAEVKEEGEEDKNKENEEREAHASGLTTPETSAPITPRG